MQTISLTIKDILHAKLILQTWYLFLSGEYRNGKITDSQLTEYLRTPLLYEEKTDTLELNFAASREVLEKFQEAIRDAVEQGKT